MFRNNSFDMKTTVLTYENCINEARLVKQLLRDMLPHDLRSRNTVCVAGSASLHWHLLSYPSDGLATSCLFQPNDVDIFVYGIDGQTEHSFKNAVFAMVDQLKHKRYVVQNIDIQTNTYILPNAPVLIINVHVFGQNTKLSFIQRPSDTTPEQVIDKFDINIVRVIYDISREEICMDSEV